MFFLLDIKNEKQRKEICENILGKLPKWFDIDKNIVTYKEEVKNGEFFTLYDDEKPVGFINIKFNNEYTAKIHLLGILEEYKGKGLENKIFENIEKIIKGKSYKFLMVKILGLSNEDPTYKNNVEFYKNIGFYSLEETLGRKNPCIIMIKPL